MLRDLNSIVPRDGWSRSVTPDWSAQISEPIQLWEDGGLETTTAEPLPTVEGDDFERELSIY
jgi:hypothetical protein